MKKIGLVNLCTYEDISAWSSYEEDISFLKRNNIAFIDYASGLSSKESLFQGFQKALQDEDVGVIWFVCGGSKLIEIIDLFNWDEIKKTGKTFIGLSDFTHFSIPASNQNITCYYGLALKNITKYYSIEDQKNISCFLLNLINGTNQQDRIFSLPNEHILGGHLVSSIFIINHLSIDIRKKHLFIEHHYIQGETLEDLRYYICQLCLVIKNNLPKSIILGHTILTDEKGDFIEYKTINTYIKNVISESISIPTLEIDHFKYCIKFD